MCRKDKGNTAEVLASATIHILDHFKHSAPAGIQNLSHQDQLASLSPSRKVNIRSQYISQLKDLQKL